MTKAIIIHKTGGPEVLRWEDFDPGAPGPGEVRLRHGAIGLNFIDIYHRKGLYPLPPLPAVPGMVVGCVCMCSGSGRWCGALLSQNRRERGTGKKCRQLAVFRG